MPALFQGNGMSPGERGEQNAIERDEDRKWESSVRANEGSCANSSAIKLLEDNFSTLWRPSERSKIEVI